MAPTYRKLAKRFRPVDSVVVAKMDGTANEHENITVEGFPSIFLFPAGKGAQPISYDEADRSLKVCFLQQACDAWSAGPRCRQDPDAVLCFSVCTDTCQVEEQSFTRHICTECAVCSCSSPLIMLQHKGNFVGIRQQKHHVLVLPPAQGLTLFLKERASGKFELPKKQTEEEDAADAEEAAARDSEEQAAECARPSRFIVKRSAASRFGLGALLMVAHTCLCVCVPCHAKCKCCAVCLLAE